MPNPQDPNEASGPTPPSAPTGRYISSRLREKLEAADSGPEKPIGGGGPPWGGIIGGVIVIALLIAGFMWWRGSHAQHPTAAAPAPADSTATAAADTSHAKADSSAMAAATPSPSPSPSPSPAAHAHASSGATAAKPAAASTPKEKPAHVAASEDAAPPPPKAGKPPFGISVGSFMFEDKANESRDALGTSTGLPAIVMPVDEGGTTMYHVVLGNFPTRSAAEKKASELLGSAAIHEAQVVSRPKS
jgi:cell division septation protein DedD